MTEIINNCRHFAPRILHAGYQRYKPPGIIAQLEHEQSAADAMNIPWSSRLFIPYDTPSESRVIVRGKIHSKDRVGSIKEYYRWIRCISINYDIILLRYMPHDIRQLIFLIGSRLPTFTVHHTIEGSELRSDGSMKSHVKWMLECILGPLSISRSFGVISVTREIAKYELSRSIKVNPIFIYPNGAIVDRDMPIIDKLEEDSSLNIIFAASEFVPWHGLDRLIASAKDYSGMFVMHVVGRVSESDRISAGDDQRFVFHGELDAERLGELIRICHLGLSSFALDRKNITEACTLKVREYLANGISVYSGHKDVFPENFRFYRCGSCDIGAIVNMAREARSWSRREVRAAAVPYIDKSILLMDLYKKISAFHRA